MGLTYDLLVGLHDSLGVLFGLLFGGFGVGICVLFCFACALSLWLDVCLCLVGCFVRACSGCALVVFVFRLGVCGWMCFECFVCFCMVLTCGFCVGCLLRLNLIGVLKFCLCEVG